MANASAAQSGIDGLTMACVPLKDYNQAPTERLCALHQTAGRHRDMTGFWAEKGKGSPQPQSENTFMWLWGGGVAWGPETIQIRPELPSSSAKAYQWRTKSEPQWRCSAHICSMFVTAIQVTPKENFATLGEQKSSITFRSTLSQKNLNLQKQCGSSVPTVVRCQNMPVIV